MLWTRWGDKLENVLLDADGVMTVAEFGLAYDFSSGGMAHGPLGPSGYRSPEVIHGKLYSAKTDAYPL